MNAQTEVNIPEWTPFSSMKPGLEKDLALAKMDAACKNWINAGISAGKLPSDFLSERYGAIRQWIGDQVISRFGLFGFTVVNLDLVYADLEKQQKAQEEAAQDFRMLQESHGAQLVDWLARPTISYFDGEDQHNLAKFRLKWAEYIQAGKVLSLQDWVTFVESTMWDEGAWHWKINDEQLSDLIRRAQGDAGMVRFAVVRSVQALEDSSDPDPLRGRTTGGDVQIVGGKLADRFGLERCQQLFQAMTSRAHHNRPEQDRNRDIDQKARDARANREQDPREQIVVAQDLLETISGHGGKNHAATQREQRELHALASKYVRFNSDQDKAKAKTFIRTYELSGYLDADIFQCLKDVKSRQNQMAGLGRY